MASSPIVAGLHPPLRMSKPTDRAPASHPAPRREAAPARLSLHGDPRVVLEGGRPLVLERRAAALCALAALEPGTARERAARWLWPDSDDPRRNLRQQLLRFRRGLDTPLLAEGDTLALAPGVQLTAPEPGAALLGELDFGDCPEFAAWLDARRSVDRLAHAGGLCERIARAEVAGDLDAALAAAEALLAVDPGSEAHHRELMRLHYLRGDSAAGLAVHQRLARQLAHTHHARPHADTEALARALRDAAVPAPVTPRSVLPTLQRPPRLIGRERELAAVVDGWAAGAVVLLLGEAGMGKSRLIAEIARERRLAVVQGRPGDVGIPYATLARLLREALPSAAHDIAPEQRRELARVLPELAPTVPLPADGQRLVLQNAVRHVLSGASVEAVAVDDLHFADDASIEMLLALAGDGGPVGPCWLFAQRPAEGGAAALALHDTLQEAGTLRSVALVPLDAAAMVALIDSLGLGGIDAAALAPQLVRHTGGNPLYALETLKQALTTDGVRLGHLPRPVSVGGLIERRIRQLSERALALARVAAIAGVDFGVALAEEVMGLRAVEFTSAFGELESAGVLRDGVFAHDLVVDAVLRSIPTSIARHLHAAVATQLGRREGVPARVAAHWLAAGDERRALPWLIKAADQARDGLRRREEAEFLERAAIIAADQSDAESPSAHALWLRVHQALECVDGELGAMRALDQALAHARSPRDRLEVLAMRVSAQVKQIDLTAAIADGREALRLASELGDDRMTAEVLMPLAIALSTCGQGAEATTLLDAHWPAVERLDDPEPTNFIEHGVVLDNLGRPLEARASHRRGVELALLHKQHSEFVIGSKNLAVNHIDTGELEAAMTLLDAAERERRAHDALQGINHLSWNLQAMALRDLGRYAESLERFDVAMAVTREQLPARLPLDRLHRAWLWAWIGQWARAQQDLQDHDDYGVLPAWVHARALQLRGRLAQWRGLPLGDLPERARCAVGDGALRPVRDSIDIDAALASGLLSPMAAAEAQGRLLALRDRARHDGYYGARWAAELACARLTLKAGALDAAREHVQACMRRPPIEVPLDCAPGCWWHALWRLSQQLRDSEWADAARAEGVAWIHRTLHNELPSEFHASFRHAVPANRELLAG